MRSRKWIGMVLTGTLALGGAGVLSACSAPSSQNGSGGAAVEAKATTVSFIDDAGRENTIPAPDYLTSVYCTSPIGQVYLFSLTPEKAAGTTMKISEAEMKYLPECVSGLENIGSWAMGGTLDTEGLIANGVQMIINVSNAALTDGDIDSANALQDQTGIPVLLFDGTVDKTPETYRSIGRALGQTEAAEEKAEYLEGVLKDVTEAVATVPESERVSVYYAEGPKGLKTEPENSPHFATFKQAGAKDVATCDLTKGPGMTDVSLEDVIAWNPQVIIAWDDVYKGGADELIRTDSNWASIDAVANNRVYTIPCLPYTWGDRPPSVTRYIGMQWMANKLYPDVYNVNMVDETKKFYKIVLNVELTDDEAQSILFEK